jgi:hypothetical protein
MQCKDTVGSAKIPATNTSAVTDTSPQHAIDVALVQAAISKTRPQVAAGCIHRDFTPSRIMCWLHRMARMLSRSPYETLPTHARSSIEKTIRDPEVVKAIVERHTARARIIEPYGPLPKRPPIHTSRQEE